MAGAAFGPVDNRGYRIACCLQGDIAIVERAFVFSAVVLPRQVKISVGAVCLNDAFGKVGLFALALIRHLGCIGLLTRIPRFFRLRLVGRHQRAEGYGQDSGQK